ncbi:MAG: helix-turn-helix transcriptional regulator [Dehalococcoidia bacterium]|nr:helix-turn-helix transcriptional regulator [Dehalococcoidia bacterium]
MARIGDQLRAARQERGLSIEEASRETRISRRFLEALEHDEFEALPAPVYARGFLRSYAGFLGLDAEPLVAEMRAGSEEGTLGPTPGGVSRPERPAARERNPGRAFGRRADAPPPNIAPFPGTEDEDGEEEPEDEFAPTSEFEAEEYEDAGYPGAPPPDPAPRSAAPAGCSWRAPAIRRPRRQPDRGHADRRRGYRGGRVRGRARAAGRR